MGSPRRDTYTVDAPTSVHGPRRTTTSPAGPQHHHHQMRNAQHPAHPTAPSIYPSAPSAPDTKTMAPKLSIHPPLLNTACPWATTPAHLEALLRCPSTGAITTRTSLIEGFPHDDAVHRYAFLDPASGLTLETGPSASPVGSINSLGYSPLPLDAYLAALSHLSASLPDVKHKTAIVSVAGPPSAVAECYARILAASDGVSFPLAIEVNLSCPNIRGASAPPGYDPVCLGAYLAALPGDPLVPVGIKTPPYTYAGQFTALADILALYVGRVSFVTATNTLGCSVFNKGEGEGEGEGEGASWMEGGLAGAGIHPLSLGNVRMLRRALDGRGLAGVQVIGVGGVHDAPGYRRMRGAGAEAVGLATALGARGVGVFESIGRDVGSAW
ncbi:dihydroorotate oxidase B, catalytic subunit [Metarhizium guizhouense ARSEF 977]|uniref:Dihydroorotate oxidase B, catalytic subunit n=1 Tax=Metarhizium guizhouense (strain ARSEF 977) TaxID=1276136 RepID=A0A0B4G4T3_METGA|nr:dihydroorotate oxidase B, catalytic subunit [Metarhizium guizhouense ARSEF 977]